MPTSLILLCSANSFPLSGAVQFRIKGNNVVVTKPNGEFVTILKNGVNNTSVRHALNGVSK